MNVLKAISWIVAAVLCAFDGLKCENPALADSAPESPVHFGAQWLYTLQTRVLRASRCAIRWKDPESFFCSSLNNSFVEISFVPVVVGEISSTLILPEGEIVLHGSGLQNPFRTTSLDFRLPFDTTYEPWVYLHNPLSTPLRLKEVYMTNPSISIDVPEGTSWTIPAQSTRPIARVLFEERGHYGGSYLRIRSRRDELSLYLPVRTMLFVKPTGPAAGLFYPDRTLQIGSLFTTGNELTVPLNIVNLSPNTLALEGSTDNHGIKVVSPEDPVAPGDTCTFKVTVDPRRLDRSTGEILLRLKRTASGLSSSKMKLQVPYTLQLLNGSLQAANSKFYIGGNGKRAFAVDVTNRVNTKLSIDRIYVNSAIMPTPPITVAEEETVSIKLPEPSKEKGHRFNSTLRLLTNVTEFTYNIEYYSGELDLMVDDRRMAKFLNFGTIGLGQKKKIQLDFFNGNPVPIQIEYYASNLTSALLTQRRFLPLTLGAYESLRVVLTVSSSVEGRVSGDITVKTDFGLQSWLFVFQASLGTLRVADSDDSRIFVREAFPFKVSGEKVYLESTFDEPLTVTSARIEDDRFSFDIVDSPVILPDAKNLLGTISYSPRCKQCYVGIGEPLDPSSANDLYLWRGMQEKLKETTSVEASLVVDSQQLSGFVLPITVNHKWPSITPPGTLRFETTLLGHAFHETVIVDNPSDHPLMIQAYISTTGGPEVNAIVAAQHDKRLAHISSAFSIDRSVQNAMSIIPPRSKKEIHVRFDPMTVGVHVGVLVVRNNLTAVSSVLLQGEGGVGKILLAGQEPGGTIVFDINSSLLKDCANLGLYTTLKKYPVAKNVGHVPIRVKSVLINNMPCMGFGFKVRGCQDHGFTIKPNASHRLEINYTPEFSVSRVEVVLSIVLVEDTVFNFNIVVSLPKSSIASCAEAITRPPWESLLYFFCLVVSVLLVVCTLCFAFLDSNRVLKDTLYETRARWEPRQPFCLTRVAANLLSSLLAMAYPPRVEEPERAEQRASVATQTGIDENHQTNGSVERKKDRHEAQRNRRKDSGQKREPRRRKKEVPENEDIVRSIEAISIAAEVRDSITQADVEVEAEEEVVETDILDADDNEEHSDKTSEGRGGSNTPIEAETASEDNSEGSSETPIATETIRSPDESDGLVEGNGRKKKNRIGRTRNRYRQDSPVSNTSPTPPEYNKEPPKSNLSATLPDVCVSAASAQRKPSNTPSPPVEQQLPRPERRRDNRDSIITGHRQKKRESSSFRAIPMSLQQEINNRRDQSASVSPRTVSYSSVVSGNPQSRMTATVVQTRRGNPPPGFAPRPQSPGFHRYPSLTTTPTATLSRANQLPQNSGHQMPMSSEQGEEQEMMAPLIRSIINSVIPSDSRENERSLSWNTIPNGNSTNVDTGCSLWGESSWQTPTPPSVASRHEPINDLGSFSSVDTVASPTLYPTFLRRSPETAQFDLTLDSQRRHWNQQTPRSMQQFHMNPPAMSPTNDYSYTGTDIWASSTFSNSVDTQAFPSPIGTPWTPFRSPSLSFNSLRGQGFEGVQDKKNQ